MVQAQEGASWRMEVTGVRFWPDRRALRVVRAACTFLSKGS